MQRALALAARARFSAHPNPMVGCVIVRDNTIIGEGWHIQPGAPHAEIHALQQAGTAAKNADVYVTLEPCCHIGRTPPCIDALIRAQVKRVFVAVTDPNPKVNGQGIQRLQQAGIEVITGIAQQAAYQLNRKFMYAMQQHKPYVIAKWAMTTDGHLTMADKTQRWITGEIARQHAHMQRAQAGAILIGANTLRHDNPQLTARLPLAATEIIQQPLRIILSTAANNLSLQSHLLSANLPGETWLVTAQTTNIQHALPTNVKHIILPHAQQPNQIDLTALLKQLFLAEKYSLIVEGGTQVLTQFFAENLVNEAHLYQSQKHSGWRNIPTAPFISNTQHWQLNASEQLATDTFLQYYLAPNLPAAHSPLPSGEGPGVRELEQCKKLDILHSIRVPSPVRLSAATPSRGERETFSPNSINTKELNNV